MNALFCKNMNFLRTQLDYSFTDLSNLCRSKGIDISAPTLQRYEVGKIKNVPYDSIIILSEIFGVSPIVLVGWDKIYLKENLSVIFSPQEQEHIKKYRQLDADGKEEIDDLIDVKLAKLQRKAEEGATNCG